MSEPRRLQQLLDKHPPGFVQAVVNEDRCIWDPAVRGRVIARDMLDQLPVRTVLDFLPLVELEGTPFPRVRVVAGNEVMNKLLRTAVRLNHVPAVKWLLEGGAEPETLREDSILKAISNGFTEIVTSLLEVYSAMPAGLLCRMLLCACGHGNFELAKALIEKGADANEGDELDLPLPLVCKREPFDIALAQLLLDNGADVNKPNPDNFLVGSNLMLHFACESESDMLRLALFLLDNGADPERLDREGKAALHYAAIAGNVEIAGLLLDRGADPDFRDREGNTALHHAAFAGNGEIAGLLLDRDADIGAKRRFGQDAARFAEQNKQWRMCQFLMAKGSDKVELPKPLPL